MKPEEVSNDIEELERIRTEAGRWKLGGTLAILAIILICVWKIYSSYAALAKPGPAQETLRAEFMDGVKKNIVPSVTNQVAAAVKNEIGPTLETELKKIQTRSPEILAAVQLELGKLTNSIPAKAQKILDDTFGAMLDEQEKKLREKYPDLTEEKVQALLTQMQEALIVELEGLTEELFLEHMVQLDQITVNIQRIKDSDEPNLSERDASWELADLVVDIVRQEFQNVDPEDETARMIEKLFIEGR